MINQVAEVIVASSMVFTEPTQIVRHFLKLVDQVGGITNEIVYCAVSELQYKLDESPTGAPRLLLGVELTSILCEKGENRVAITSAVEIVLKQYSKVLLEMILRNGRLVVGNVESYENFSKDEHELALDIAHFITISLGYDPTGIGNTLVRTIVARAPEEVLEAKICQLESPDFGGDQRASRERFHEVFAGEYLKRFHGLWQVLTQLRHSTETKMIPRDEWECNTSMPEEFLWKELWRLCEVTNPTSDQLQQRQRFTSELMRRYPNDDTVKEWYSNNFAHLITT